MKIAIVAGGTYGHIYPALSLISTLREKHIADVLFVSPNQELEPYLSGQKIKTRFIDNTKFNSNSVFSFIQSLHRFIKTIRVCFNILLSTRPEVVVGFGGYAAFPLVFCACILRIPTAIHEQNVTLGKANRVLSYLVKRVFLSFDKTKVSLKKKKIVVTGNPIRKELKPIDKKEALGYLGLEEGLFTVAVIGGSVGSCKINKTFIDAIMRMKDSRLQVIHLTGKGDFEHIDKFYNESNSTRIPNRVFSFFQEMSYVFSAVDLVISRAGGSVIAELSYFKLPSILIPYPYAGAHQTENAKILADAHKAVIIEDKNLDSKTLSEHLGSFITHPEKITEMKRRFGISRENNFNAADRIAQELISLK
jgi:UDP-N-acetylglucosamine--N-acetylmuramyl-(pentapeptide) pyrophosphoryl-undecaprenol N-acetylglucosamine transferase